MLLTLSAVAIRPSTVSTTTSGCTGGCTITNIGYSIDNDLSTYGTLAFGVVTSATITAEYTWTSNIAITDLIDLRFSRSDAAYAVLESMNQISGAVMNEMVITLRDASGVALATYTQANPMLTALMGQDGSGNGIFVVRIANPSSITRRVDVAFSTNAGVSKSLNIFDVNTQPQLITRTTTASKGVVAGGSISTCDGLASGLGLPPGVLTCINMDEDHVTKYYDPNTEYGLIHLNQAVTIDITENYLYQRYTWDPADRGSGMDDYYVIMENQTLVDVEQNLLGLFSNQHISLAVGFADNTVKTFTASMNSSFVETDLMGMNSGRAQIRVRPNEPGKTVQYVEMRYHPQNASISSGIRVYDAYWGSTAGILPLTFITFKAELNSGMAFLNWTTHDATDLSHFVVERSQDASSFTSVGTVESRPGIGLSSHTFIDQEPLAGDNYYRIRQVDLDGEWSLSPLRMLTVDTEPTIMAYPNPVVDGILNVLLSGAEGPWRITMIDGVGRVVTHHEVLLSHSEALLMEVPVICCGIFTLRAEGGTSFVSTTVSVVH